MKALFGVVKGIITVFLIIVLLLVVFQKMTSNKLTLGNIYIFQVASESMMPNYKVGDIIVVKKLAPQDYRIGDDVTYLGRESNLAGLVITHRIVNMRSDEYKHYFVTKGIDNEVEDPEINEDDIYGKVIYHTILFSFVGRLMTNIVVYYLLFISVGVAFAYEVVSSFLIKKDDEE